MTSIDYNPKLWGGQAWVFLEYIALGYPDKPTDKEKEEYSKLFKSFEFTLPCKECRLNYSLHIEETPLENYLKNSYSLFEWVVIMQNKINLMQNKPMKDHEKLRTFKFKHNANLENGSPCCNKQARETPQQKKRNVESLQKNIRAKKNELRKARELRKLRNKKRKQ